ncbi:hypothetical protein [Burkholderia sp. BCC0405]|uniref:hypothetical protein n=1 Tax=Burkholderia sp. BCC0405 TaxID=2676298 RepID=UPI00158B4B7B|nr:hypothetical protein [Burkholderia sp. BCC0405]
MDWSDIAGVIGKAAPVVGTLLGGPARAAVGGLISSALGTDNTPQAVSSALAADPDAIAKIQELQTNAKVQLQQLVVAAELSRLHASNAPFVAEAADRDSVPHLAAQQPHDWVRPTMTLLLLGGAGGIVFCVLTGISTDLLKNPTASLTVGALIAQWFNEVKASLAFYFGATKDRDDQSTAPSHR